LTRFPIGTGVSPEERFDMQQENSAHVSGETFDNFLEEQGLLAATEEVALKEIIADQIRQAMPPFLTDRFNGIGV
jgi:hypothetical protein